MTEAEDASVPTGQSSHNLSMNKAEGRWKKMKNKYIKPLLLFSFCLCGLFQAALSFLYSFSPASFPLLSLKMFPCIIYVHLWKCLTLLEIVLNENAAGRCREEKKISQGSYGKLTCCSVISDVNVVHSMFYSSNRVLPPFHSFPPDVRAIRVHAIVHYSWAWRLLTSHNSQGHKAASAYTATW